MKKYILIFLIPFMGKSLLSQEKVRHFHDSIGFAKHDWQMDSIFARIDSIDKIENERISKAVINPHDDYKYAGGLYAKTLSGIKADKIILVGVAHRARNFELADKIIFGSFDSWEGPYGKLKVSALRNEIISKLKKESYVVHDSMMQLEHSLEAILPFLQHQNPETEIVPLLIPYMKFEDMKALAAELAEEFSEIIKEQHLKYGEDIAVVISNDAIHYGSEDWGGSNLAPFGTDSIGNEKAHQKDLQIIDESLRGKLSNDKIKIFNEYTVEADDYKAYKWTWCGRYSVPFGLLLANDLNKILNGKDLTGEFIDYRSSIKNKHIQVEDLGMGVTAPAKQTHWVAYLGMGYQ
ncbi:AmmeMemoRadiSam system protein B [Gramella sp. AN32]|uniref:AmmeMemoRadiSam system protein B n=1 Tax=Christiangramia antarctica TaxID=2058158 RepID=A0ABW5X435_9FLAO|nr:AmmeMemoRadiSam system protein B [Gramella sp. AN32]MCM4157691.1 AmmeMemoRadiSam system protein B [Gramella sp. AN32]